MEVLDAAVHRMIKASGGKECEVDPAEAPLEPSDLLNRLVSRLLETYNRRTSHRNGTFDPDVETYPFSTHLRSNVNGESSFFDLTKWAIGRLQRLMAKQVFATGGYIFFAKYRVNAGDFFVVAKLTDAVGESFSDDMTKVESARHISTDRLQQVGRVNLDGWAEQSGKYLTFVNAREGGQSANYFLEFLGCSEPTNGPTETKKLVAVIDEYCGERELAEPEALALKRAAHTHLKAMKGEPLSIAALANVIHPDDPAAFIEFVNNHEHAPTDGATIDGNSLRSLVRYVVKMKDATLSMSAAFKIEHNVEVTDTGDLIIHNVDVKSVKEQLS